MNKQQEIYVLNKFRQLYNDFPIGKEEHIDSPDFIVTQNLNKKLGIELTEVVHSQGSKQLSSEEMNFTDLVIAKLIHLLPYHFSLKIYLLPEIGVSKSKREKISQEVANFCVDEFSELSDVTHADVEHIDYNITNAIPFVRGWLASSGFRNLPEGIKSISIFRYDSHGSSFNSQSEAAVIPYFSNEMICNVLKNKEGKLQTYKRCDEYWLIIWQGEGITGYFQDIQFETPISSTFDKVFIVRNVQNDLIILKP